MDTPVSQVVTEVVSEVEPLLQQTDATFVFVSQRTDLYELYKQHRSMFWSPEEINVSRDLHDFTQLNSDEQHFLEHILAFFAVSDGLVNDNIVQNFYNDVQYAEARAFYAVQILIETIHAETYTLLLQTIVPDTQRQAVLFDAVQNFPAIRAKTNWLKKWTDRQTRSFAERLIAFVAIEGIFFSGSFCAIFWLKNRGLLPGLTFSNELIARDEKLHCVFAINLFNNHLINKISQDQIKGIFLEAFEVEKTFVSESLPVNLIGMNSVLMVQYIQCVCDFLLKQLHCSPLFNMNNPFPFMDMINLEGKTNFFEKNVSEYQKLNTTDQIRFDDF